MNDADQTLQSTHLNLQTGRVSWAELERHFARGVVLVVAAELDLVEVAEQFATDDQAKVSQELTSGTVRKAEMSDAATWHQNKTEFWAVVAAPFVLIQIVS